MLDIEFAAAVSAAVVDWLQSTTPAQRQMEMSNPATLTIAMGLAVQQLLIRGSHSPAVLRSHALRVPFCHLTNVFDAGSLVNTPSAFFPVPETVGTMAGRAAALAVLGVLQNEAVSYGTENEGNLFVNLVAMSGSGAFAEKSKKSMRGHTDGVSFPFNGDDNGEDPRIAPSPDLVILVALRNPNHVATTVMSLPEVLAQLSPNDVIELKKPQFSIRSQPTFVQGMKAILGKELVVIDEPVLKDVLGGTWVRYSHNTVVPTTSGGIAEQASNYFEAACNQVAISVVMEPGDVLIINNRLGLHGRGLVGDQVGGQSRWLLRTYGLDSSKLPAHKRHPGGKPPYVLFP
jgi:L-asparagine oxygenase